MFMQQTQFDDASNNPNIIELVEIRGMDGTPDATNPKVLPGSLNGPDLTGVSNKALMMAMITMLQGLLATLQQTIQNQSDDLQNQSKMSSHLASIGQDIVKEIGEAIDKMIKEEQAQKDMALAGKIIGGIILGLSFILTLMTAGVMSSLILLAVGVVTMTGVFDDNGPVGKLIDKGADAISKGLDNACHTKFFENNPSVMRFILKMVVILAVTLVAGGIASLGAAFLDDMVASAAQSIKTALQNAFTKTAEEGEEQEMQEIVQNVAKNAAENAAETASTSTTNQASTSENAAARSAKIKYAFKFVSVNTGTQLFLSSNASNDLMSAITTAAVKDEDKRKMIAAIAAAILNIIVAIASIGLMPSAPEELTSSDVNGIFGAGKQKMVRVVDIFERIMLGLQGLNNIGQGIVTVMTGLSVRDLANLQSDMILNQGLSQMLNTQTKISQDKLKNLMQQLEAAVASANRYTVAEQEAAKVLAANA